MNLPYLPNLPKNMAQIDGFRSHRPRELDLLSLPFAAFVNR